MSGGGRTGRGQDRNLSAGFGAASPGGKTSRSYSEQGSKPRPAGRSRWEVMTTTRLNRTRHRHRRPRRHPARRLPARLPVPDRRHARHRQDHARDAVPARRHRGAARRCLYVTLSETRAEIEKVARSHGWDLVEAPHRGARALRAQPVGGLAADGLQPFRARARRDDRGADRGRRTSISRSGSSSTRCPSCGSSRRTPLRYRRQILALKQFFSDRDCTVLMLDDRTGGDRRRSPAEHRARRRRARAARRTSTAPSGGGCASARCAAWRSAAATTTSRFARAGSTCFRASSPRSIRASFAERDLPSGNAQLDGLLGGGLPAGTSTLLLGPAGTGKSTIATQFATAAAARGERTAMFVFDENIGTFRSRSRKLGMPIDEGARTTG